MVARLTVAVLLTLSFLATAFVLLPLLLLYIVRILLPS